MIERGDDSPTNQLVVFKLIIFLYFIFAILNKFNNKIIVGCMAIRVNPGNFTQPSGRVGYVRNMYTASDYGKRGNCSEIVARLIESAMEMGIFSFKLHATKMDEPAYQQFF